MLGIARVAWWLLLPLSLFTTYLGAAGLTLAFWGESPSLGQWISCAIFLGLTALEYAVAFALFPRHDLPPVGAPQSLRWGLLACAVLIAGWLLLLGLEEITEALWDPLTDDDPGQFLLAAALLAANVPVWLTLVPGLSARHAARRSGG